jgi:hypothetical protein
MKKLFLLVVAVCLLSCPSGTDSAVSGVSIKIEMPTDYQELGSLSCSIFIVAVDSETSGKKYIHYCTVKRPETKARLPSVPAGASIKVYAWLFPLEPLEQTEYDKLPFFGEADAPYKVELYPTSPITVQLNTNPSTSLPYCFANGGKFYFINNDYSGWDEVHVFTPPTAPATSVEFKSNIAATARLLVAGGGGRGGDGGANGGGGGGGAGYIYISDILLEKKDYSVMIGAGGSTAVDSDGAYSQFDDGSSPPKYVAGGGAGGGPYNDVGRDATNLVPTSPPPTPPTQIGGGGGGGWPTTGPVTTAGGNGGNIGTSGQLRNGGEGYNSAIAGGGSGTLSRGIGGGEELPNPGSGGDGILSDISGSAVYYGGGGGAGGGGAGGSGAGGNGGISGANKDGSAAKTYGSGGGGGGSGAGAGGAGGDGVVYVRFPYDFNHFIKTR